VLQTRQVRCPQKLAKLIAEKGIVMESKRLYDNQIPAWIGEYFKQNNYQVEPDARELLAEYLGTELSRVSNELDKLMLALPKGTTINKKHIEENIGISKDFNIFELQTALARKDDFKCLQIVEFFGTNLKDNPLVVVIGSLYGFFSKLLIAQTCRQGSDKDMIAAIFPNEDANQWQRLSWKLRDYKTGLQHFNRKQTEDAISLLHEYDMRVKGVNNDSTPESELMREMVLRMLI
jgi:DNA polymerase-3 subunit delta